MFNLYQKVKALNGQRGIVLLLVMLLSATMLGVINYFTIKTTSALRVYIHGESHYSKGQKDATNQLITYIIEEDHRHYKRFKEEIQVPVGDSIARVTLSADGDPEVIRRGFIQGNNHPEDVPHLVWLFKNFQHISFMSDAIGIWKDADRLVGELINLGNAIHEDLQNDAISPVKRANYLEEITTLSEKLTARERAFSEHLGYTARTITNALFVFNLVAILVIVGSAAWLISIIIKALEESRKELQVINQGLIQTNSKLDSFLYASSHDLKSPINNLEGLLHIFTIQSKTKDPDQLELMEKMNNSVDNLKMTIANVENLIKLDRLELDDVQDVNLMELVQEIMEENEMSFITDKSELKTDFQVPAIHYSRFALKSILYNLISNAVKYQSPQRKLELLIATYRENDRTVLKVSDNGLGIDLQTHGDKLFKMFKRFHQHNTGSGLGLYAVKDIVEKNGGQIRVESEVEKGTTFWILF